MSANQIRLTVLHDEDGNELCVKCKRKTKTHAKCKKCRALLHYGYRVGPDPEYWHGVRYKRRDVCCPCVLTREMRIPEAASDAYIKPAFDYGG